MKNIVCYSRCGCKVYLSADKYILDALNFQLKKFFNIQYLDAIAKDEWSVLVEKNNIKYQSLHLEYVLLKQVPEPDISVYFSGEKKLIGLLLENNCEWQIQNIIRFVRVILRMLCQERGHLFLHGGFVQYKSKGICILGAKKVGKTSTILSLLKDYKVDFISNDDVSVYYKDGKWIGEGWPRSVVIRQDTWNKFEEVNCKLRHPLNKNSSDPCFYPEQLCDIFRRQLLVRAEVNYIVFPVFSSRSLLRVLNQDEACTRIEKNFLSNPGKYNEYLLEYFTDNSGLMKREFINYSKNILCIELCQNFEKLNEGTTLLIDYLDKNIGNDIR